MCTTSSDDFFLKPAQSISSALGESCIRKAIYYLTQHLQQPRAFYDINAVTDFLCCELLRSQKKCLQ